MEFKGTAKLAYYKDNCEEELIATPISVLRYISILETHIEESKAPEMLEMLNKVAPTLERYGEIEQYKEVIQLIKEATEI
jgi:hypothetical protein